MKKLILPILLFITVASFAQTNSLGVRLGELNGITLKSYTNNYGNAIETSIGIVSNIYHNRNRYSNNFNSWADNNGHHGAHNLEVFKTTPIGLQAHYLFNNKMDDVTGGLIWYYGGGAQVRFSKYSYQYWYENEQYTEDFLDLDVGVHGIIGLEYKIPHEPFRVFIDAALFVEIVDNPLFTFGQLGLGIRYDLH